MYITKTSISLANERIALFLIRATWRSGLCKFVRVGQVWKMKFLHEGGGVWGVSRVILRLFYTLYHAVTKKKSQVFFSPSTPHPHNRPTLRNFLRVGGMWKLKFLHKGGSVWGVSGVEPGLFYTLCHTKTKYFFLIIFSTKYRHLTFHLPFATGRPSVKLEILPQGRQRSGGT